MVVDGFENARYVLRMPLKVVVERSWLLLIHMSALRLRYDCKFHPRKLARNHHVPGRNMNMNGWCTIALVQGTWVKPLAWKHGIGKRKACAQVPKPSLFVLEGCITSKVIINL